MTRRCSAQTGTHGEPLSHCVVARSIETGLALVRGEQAGPQTVGDEHRHGGKAGHGRQGGSQHSLWDGGSTGPVGQGERDGQLGRD